MNNSATPAMKQYYEAKSKYPDSLIFFRMGDFYESFDEDAKVISRELDITLTKRGKSRDGTKMPLAGIPYHAIDLYLPRLIKKGYKVAICEQLENPKFSKGIVKRGVIRVVTPGTAIDASIVTNSLNNYLMSICINYDYCNSEISFFDDINITFGISFLDVSTGDFLTTQIQDESPYEKIFSEIENMMPSECLIHDTLKKNIVFMNRLKEYSFLLNYFTIDANINDALKKSNELILNQFKLNEEEFNNLNLQSNVYSLLSCSQIIQYVFETQQKSLFYLKPIKYYNTYNQVLLDSITLNHLEILKNLKNNGNTLYSVLNKTNTSIGSRTLKNWISRPLLNILEIGDRLNTVEYFIENPILTHDIKFQLENISDIERIIGRLIYGSSNARDLLSLQRSLISIMNIYNILEPYISNSYIFKLLCMKLKKFNLFSEIMTLISSSIKEEAPISVKDGNIIKENYNKELDELRYQSTHIKEWISSFQQNERDRTGIRSLKIRYNKVFGYYIEVTNTNLNQVPDNYIRKQTMSNCERYFTTELKEQENIILSSEEKIISLEYNLFVEIVQKICVHYSSLQEISSLIGSLDVLICFSIISKEYNYTKPLFSDSKVGEIIIKNGRHPIVEMSMKEQFIENNTYINMETDQVLLITGPNMAGKSTYMRQIAMIIIMGQAGCFVPASYAKIDIVDKIFTRIGAHDDLSSGKSTFMVEMLELANILNNSTCKSLVLLDEIGRGTSTYDGYAIARASIEYLHNKDIYGVRTLFATHYYELTHLTNNLKKLKNYHISVSESNNSLLFLRKIIDGSTDKSYGVQVARMAGIPETVVKRAFNILLLLEKKGVINDNCLSTKNFNYNNEKIHFYDLLKEMSDLDINNITPLNAMLKLFEFKNRIINLFNLNKTTQSNNVENK